MKQSRLFGKTRKDSPKGEMSINAQLLIKAGFIKKEFAGVYDYLPLGLNVINKIVAIIRKHMNEIGGQELIMSSLQSPNYWTKTHRWEDSDVNIWFKTKLFNEKVIGLAWSHEEPMTKLVKENLNSYTDLPIYIYQFQRKFRNELRSKSGILRGREFMMKDLYSFNRTEKDLNQFYEKVKVAYFKIFDDVGIGNKTYFTFASGGAFTQYSHEFQTICPSGEDTIYLDEKLKIALNDEIYTPDIAKELKMNNDKLKKLKSIEVGNIFKLGTRYSKALDLYFINEKGEKEYVIMGSYGIGIGRLMGTVVEIHHDERGIIWPKSISPYNIHLIALDTQDSNVIRQADKLYETLNKNGFSVLYDDRKIQAGKKFYDSDLIGIPLRLVMSKRTGDKVELKLRTEQKSKLYSRSEILNKIKQEYKE